ncbi:MAG: YceI family protein [Candidatus Hydrogenedentes bacterium]|nr:YceI family protein [Candidatus Hydrogenedentota bacterium]
MSLKKSLGITSSLVILAAIVVAVTCGSCIGGPPPGTPPANTQPRFGETPEDQAAIDKVAGKLDAIEKQLGAINATLAELKQNGLSVNLPAGAVVPAPSVPEQAPVAPVEPQPAPPAPEAPAAPPQVETPPAPEPTTAPAPVATNKFNIVPNDDSSISFVGYGTLHEKDGGFAVFSGSVELADGTIESAKGEVIIDLKSTYCGDSALTPILVGDKMLNVEKWPASKFTIYEVKKTDAGYSVDGNFELMGVTNGITIPIEMEKTDKGLHIKTAGNGFAIKQRDWGLTFKGFPGMDNGIGEETLISFDVLAEPAS